VQTTATGRPTRGATPSVLRTASSYVRRHGGASSRNRLSGQPTGWRGRSKATARERPQRVAAAPGPGDRPVGVNHGGCHAGAGVASQRDATTVGGALAGGGRIGARFGFGGPLVGAEVDRRVPTNPGGAPSPNSKGREGDDRPPHPSPRGRRCWCDRWTAGDPSRPDPGRPVERDRQGPADRRPGGGALRPHCRVHGGGAGVGATR